MNNSAQFQDIFFENQDSRASNTTTQAVVRATTTDLIVEPIVNAAVRNDVFDSYMAITNDSDEPAGTTKKSVPNPLEGSPIVHSKTPKKIVQSDDDEPARATEATVSSPIPGNPITRNKTPKQIVQSDDEDLISIIDDAPITNSAITRRKMMTCDKENNVAPVLTRNSSLFPLTRSRTQTTEHIKFLKPSDTGNRTSAAMSQSALSDKRSSIDSTDLTDLKLINMKPVVMIERLKMANTQTCHVKSVKTPEKQKTNLFRLSLSSSAKKKATHEVDNDDDVHINNIVNGYHRSNKSPTKAQLVGPDLNRIHLAADDTNNDADNDDDDEFNKTIENYRKKEVARLSRLNTPKKRKQSTSSDDSCVFSLPSSRQSSMKKSKLKEKKSPVRIGTFKSVIAQPDAANDQHDDDERSEYFSTAKQSTSVLQKSTPRQPQSEDNDDSNGLHCTTFSMSDFESVKTKAERMSTRKAKKSLEYKEDIVDSGSDSDTFKFKANASPSKARRKWSYDECLILVHGVNTIGLGQWAHILASYKSKFVNRSSVDLKDKYRTLKKNESELKELTEKAKLNSERLNRAKEKNVTCRSVSNASSSRHK